MWTMRECSWCGKPFGYSHLGKKVCPDCQRAVKRSIGWNIQVDNPMDRDAYERDLRRRMNARHKDTIVADGYADRQMARTLERAGKIKTTL